MPERRVSLAHASVLAWGAHVFYAVACAWPEVGGWPVAPLWVFLATAIVYGLVASWRGWPLLAGCASGIPTAPFLRTMVADDGAFAAGVGFVVATLGMAAFAAHAADPDDGTLPAREAATLLWLCGSVAAVLGVVLADVAAWGLS